MGLCQDPVLTSHCASRLCSLPFFPSLPLVPHPAESAFSRRVESKAQNHFEETNSSSQNSSGECRELSVVMSFQLFGRCSVGGVCCALSGLLWAAAGTGEEEAGSDRRGRDGKDVSLWLLFVSSLWKKNLPPLLSLPWCLGLKSQYCF